MWMAARDQAFCVVGSTTPSVETRWLTTQGRIDRVEMNERYGGVMLPEIWCADLRRPTGNAPCSAILRAC